MSNRMTAPRSTDELRYQGGAALLSLGMWLRFGTIGMLATAAGAVQLARGDAARLPYWALMIAGAALAAVAWQKLRVLFAAGELPAGPTTTARVAARLAPATR